MATTTKADSRSTKGKSAVQADDNLPAWARRELRSLSNKTGISFVKLLSSALGFGIYHLKEELGPTANLLASAEAMAKIDPNATTETERPSEEPLPAASETGGGSAGMAADPDASSTELPNARGDGIVAAKSGDAGERPAEHREAQSGNGFMADLLGTTEVMTVP